MDIFWLFVVLKCNNNVSSGEEITSYGETLGAEARIYVVQMGLVSLHKGPVDLSLLRPDPKNRPASFITKNSAAGPPINNYNNIKPPVPVGSSSNSPPSSSPPASTSSSGSVSPVGKPNPEAPGLPAQDRKSLEQRRAVSVMQ